MTRLYGVLRSEQQQNQQLNDIPLQKALGSKYIDAEGEPQSQVRQEVDPGNTLDPHNPTPGTASSHDEPNQTRHQVTKDHFRY